MRFVAIIGDAGSGKTTLMTAILYQSWQSGSKVISNYHLTGIPHTLMAFSQLATLPPEITGSVIGMDELGKGADSYEFFSAQSQKLTTLVSQSRKRHCVVYFTVQRFNLIAKRLRQQVSGFILMDDLDATTPHCICSKLPCRCRRKGYKCARQFKCTFVDQYKKVVNVTEFDGTPWGGYFDTDEIVW